MKLRSFFYALAAAVLVLLSIGAGGFYWLTSQSPIALLRGGSTAAPAAAIFVPKQAPVMVSLLVNPTRLEAFRQLVAPPGERRRSRAELNQIQQTLLANLNLDYQRDIQPWIGDELTLAVTTLDIDRDRQNGLQPGYLLVATTKNANKSREFIQLFWQKQALAGKDLVSEQYKGVNLIYPNQPESAATGDSKFKTLATAAVGSRFVALANNPKVLRDAINNVQAPSQNLSDSPDYKLALENLNAPRLGLTFVNIPGVLAWLGNSQASTTSQKYESLALTLGLNPQGLLAQTSLIAAPDQEMTAKAPTLSKPVGALEYLPNSSALAAAGTNLNELWNQLSTAPKSAATSQLLDQFQRQIQAAWNIDLPSDVFSWVQGEYALGLLPSAEGTSPDWIFVAEKPAGATDSASIEHLDEVARVNGLSVGSLPLGNQTITGWTKLITSGGDGKDRSAIGIEAQVQGVHTTAGKYEIFTTSLEAMARALDAPRNSLLANGNFKQALAPLPAPNDGYLYIDWTSLQPSLERHVPVLRVVELIGEPLFSHLRAIAVSSYGSDVRVQRSKLFFRLGSG